MYTSVAAASPRNPPRENVLTTVNAHSGTARRKARRPQSSSFGRFSGTTRSRLSPAATSSGMIMTVPHA